MEPPVRCSWYERVFPRPETGKEPERKVQVIQGPVTAEGNEDFAAALVKCGQYAAGRAEPLRLV